MKWPEERAKLEILKGHPQRSSTLKKKLSMINRLKNIADEDISSLVSDLKTENLQKFYVEISNGLLSATRIHSNDDIHRIVRIIYLYSYDQQFMGSIMSQLKKNCSSSWIYSALFAEVYFYVHGTIEPVLKTLLKNLSEGSLKLIYYLIESFADLSSDVLKKYMIKEMSKAEETNVDLIVLICRELDIEAEITLNDNYKEVISLFSGEFDFYIKKSNFEEAEKATRNSQKEESLGKLNESVKSGIKAMSLKNLENKNGSEKPGKMFKKLEASINNIEVLDEIAVEISGHSGKICDLLAKTKKNELIPSIARIISRLTRGKNEIVKGIFSDVSGSFNRNELMLVAELYKFGLIKQADFCALLSELFSSKNLRELCLVLEIVGRYMLSQRKSNEYMRGLLEALRAAKTTEMNKLHINNTLAWIFQDGDKKFDITCFFQWYFTESNFRRTGIFEKMSKDRRLMAILFMIPTIFESSEFQVGLIKELRMEGTMRDLYYEELVENREIPKQNAIKMAELLGLLCRQTHAKILEMIFSLGRLKLNERVNMILAVLKNSNEELRKEWIRKLWEMEVCRDIKYVLNNFVQEFGTNIDIEEDSFGMEIEMLQEDEYV
ncbi:hypothetical protein ENBRE01_1384 [Enteropsectra breve]|nr:hypothetical protein ENBRE01_1384 [Enteropsectra breve]